MPDESLPSSPLPYVASEEAVETGAALDRWGWLEIFVLVQLMWGVLLFIPGSQAYRTYIRAFPYITSLIALVVCARSTGTDTLVPGSRWLLAAGMLLIANLLHEETQMRAGFAQIVFQASIAAPTFWAARMGQGEARLRRVVWLILVSSFASAGIGVLQVYYPARFLPPAFSALALSFNPEFVNALSYVGPGGELIVRPPGLSDLPGGAAIAGMTAAVLGVAFAFHAGQRQVVRWVYLGVAGVGMTALYLTQVRSLFLMAVVAMLAFAAMRLRQGRLVQGTWIAIVVAALVGASFAWATMLGGETVYERFSEIFDTGLVRTYQDNRGLFLTYTFTELLNEFPLGAGLGRWGMMVAYFGDQAAWQYQPIHVEIQPTGWLLDGGVLMWLFYGGALFAAMRYSYQLATAAESSLRDLAAMVFCVQLVIVGLCFTGPVFNTQLGIEFWLVTAVLYGAGRVAVEEADIEQTDEFMPPV
jgi:hypothetical protein